MALGDVFSDQSTASARSSDPSFSGNQRGPFGTPTWEARSQDPSNPANYNTAPGGNLGGAVYAADVPGQGGTLGGAVYQNPTGYSDPTVMQNLALIGANYGTQQQDYTNLYGINRQQQDVRNQITGLDGQDINSQIRDAGFDKDYYNKMIQSYGMDIGTYNKDRQTYGQQLTNDLAGFANDRRMADFNTNNKYISGGGQFTSGYGMNLGNNQFTQQNKTTAANLQNQLQNTGLDRNINEANRGIAGAQKNLSQSDEQIGRLNNALAKNGLQLRLGNLSMDELKAQFDQRMNQLGLNKLLDSNKVWSDAASNDPNTMAQALAIMKQMMPDMFKVS